MRELSVGERLDQYRLIEVLARSGMASIFKATDEIGGQTVVLKIPYAQFETDPIFYSRFQREESIGQRLDHRLNLALTPSWLASKSRTDRRPGYDRSHRQLRQFYLQPGALSR